MCWRLVMSTVKEWIEAPCFLKRCCLFGNIYLRWSKLDFLFNLKIAANYTFVSLSRVINREGLAFRPHANPFRRRRSYIKAQITSHLQSVDRLHMTSRRPYWCPKTMERRPCWWRWFFKQISWELSSFVLETPYLVSINLHWCWPRE